MDLLDEFPASEHRKMRAIIGPGSEHQALKVEWEESQEDLEEASFVQKQAAKKKQDQNRNKDLEFLKKLGGPLTSVESLDELVQTSDLLEQEKQMRLYVEVRFAKHTCLTMKRDDEIFRLLRNHKKLSVDEYARNLRVYLGRVGISASATMSDFKSALSDLLVD